MFYTRPNLPPLGLDLMKISGGGSRPAQFYGETVDGRPVYMRYRGGRFSVHCGEIAASQKAPMQTLLDASIGPYLHGDMLLEQACDLAGITVRGERPFLSEEKRRTEAEHRAILDWSGRTTYWEQHLWVTKQGGQHFVDAMAGEFSDLVVLELWWDTSSPSHWKRRFRRCENLAASPHAVTLGVGANPVTLEKVLTSDYALRGDLEDAFAHAVTFGFGWNSGLKPKRLKPLLDHLGREVVTPDFDSHGSLGTHFRTGDPAGEAFVEKTIAVVDRCFSNRIELVDLDTGKVFEKRESFYWYSLDFREWCRTSPDDRYLGASEKLDGDDKRPRRTASRPASVDDENPK